MAVLTATKRGEPDRHPRQRHHTGQAADTLKRAAWFDTAPRLGRNDRIENYNATTTAAAGTTISAAATLHLWRGEADRIIAARRGSLHRSRPRRRPRSTAAATGTPAGRPAR